MRLLLALLVFVFCLGNSLAQNLIQNGGFEDTLVGNFGIILAKEWDSPSQGSPDFIHPSTPFPSTAPMNINGFQEAKIHKGYYGIGVFSLQGQFREYIQNELSSPLLRDSVYCLQFYLSLADSSNYALKNQLGIHFSNSKLNFQTQFKIPVTPQIEFNDSIYFTETQNWVKISATYQANGGEKYFIIGHFQENLNIDTLKIEGGNKFEHDGTYYYLDDFFLGNCDSLPEDTSIGLRENILNDKLNIYPNPFENRVVVSYEGNEELEVRLFDVMGKEVSFAYISASLKETNEMVLSVAHLPKGLYFLEIVAGENRISRKIIKQ